MDRLQVASALVVLHDAGERATRQHRVLDVDDGRKRLVLDADQLDCIGRRGFGLGDHERDRLSRKDDLGARERLGGPVGAGRRDREILCDEDGDDSGQRQRLVAIDAPDQRVRLRREHEPAVEEPVHVPVRREAGCPRDLVRRVLPRARDSDDALGQRSSMRVRARSSARPTTIPAR